jgi:hypothetical protein
MVTSPPSTRPVPYTVSGSPPPSAESMRTPTERSASTSGPSGRFRAYGSPSKDTGPPASPATGGMKRMTVPASPTSTAAGPNSGLGRTTQRSSSAVDT